MNNTNSPNHPTIADLERLANELALMPDDVSETEPSINATKRVRKQYKFWLDQNRGGDLALCQYLDILKSNRKLKPFLELALRYAILDYSTRKHYAQDGIPVIPFEYVDDIQAEIDWILDNLNWGK